MYKEGDYTAPDENSAEYELQALLYGWVRYTKPLVCVETGSYRGHTARRIGEALAENGKGILYTCDIDPVNVGRTFIRTSNLPVVVKWCSGRELICGLNTCLDFIFLDSSDRVGEARALLGRLNHPAWVFLHDTEIHHKEDLWEIKAMTNWGHLQLPYSRGVTIFPVGLPQL